MVEKNSFLGNMMDRSASGGNKPTDAVSRVDNPSTPNYDVATFNIIKLRLIEQRTQLNRMVDYSQDAAIKLNDIYEILKDMRGSSSKEVTRVDEEQVTYQSSLDNFFKQNGYIPVKILNPQQVGDDFEIDIDGKKRRRRSGRGKWGAILGGLAALAGIAGVVALSGSMNDLPDAPALEPLPTPDLVPVEPAPDLRPQSEAVPGNDLPVEPFVFGIPSISGPSSAPTQIPEATAPDVIPAPGPSPLSDLAGNKTLASIMTALAALMASVQMLSSKAAGAPPVGVGGVDSMFNRSRPRLGGGGRISAIPDAELLLMSMNGSKGSGVKTLTLEAKEINFEADKFDFIQRSLFATPTPTNNMIVPTSYSPPPSSSGGGGRESASGTGYATGPDGGTPSAPNAGSGYGGGATQSGRSAGGGGTVRGDTAVTPGMGASMPNIPAGATISQQQAYQLALGAGFTPEEAKIMAAIAVAESGLKSSAFNGNAATGDESYGLWQINMLGKMGPERRALFGIESNDQLFDPATNARAAYQIYKLQGFDAWSVYKSGKYKQYENTDLSGESTTTQLQSTAPGGMAALSGVKPAISSFLSGISDALAGLSKDVTMNLETPQRPTTGGAINIVNSVNPSVPPAYRGVDEPMAAMDDMIEKLLGEMV